MPRVSVHFVNCVQRDQMIDHLGFGHFDQHEYRKFRDTTIVVGKSGTHHATLHYGGFAEHGDPDPECPPGLYPGQDVYLRVFPFTKTVETLKDAWNMWRYGADVEIQTVDCQKRIDEERRQNEVCKRQREDGSWRRLIRELDKYDTCREDPPPSLAEL